MFAAVSLLAVLASVSASSQQGNSIIPKYRFYTTNLEKGRSAVLNAGYGNTKNFYILDGQGSGLLTFPDDYNCYNPYDKQSPYRVPDALGIKVEEPDFEGAAEIQLSSDYKVVKVFRAGNRYQGKALLSVTAYCFPLGEHRGSHEDLHHHHVPNVKPVTK